MKKTIRIIGAGNTGKAVATHSLKNGYSVLNNSKRPDTLQDVVSKLGNRAKAVTDEADMILLLFSLSIFTLL